MNIRKNKTSKYTFSCFFFFLTKMFQIFKRNNLYTSEVKQYTKFVLVRLILCSLVRVTFLAINYLVKTCLSHIIVEWVMLVTVFGVRQIVFAVQFFKRQSKNKLTNGLYDKTEILYFGVTRFSKIEVINERS